MLYDGNPSFPIKTSLSFPVGCFAVFQILASATVECAPVSLDISAGEELRWSTVSGTTYQVQWSANPGDPESWADLGSAVAGDGETRSMVDPGPGGRHYRVKKIAPGTAGATGVINALANGGFELGAGTAADNWTATGGIHSRTNADSHAGTFSHRASISNVGSTPGSGLLVQRLALQGGSVAGGKAHTFSFWAKQITAGPSYVQYYQVQWQSAAGAVIGSTGYQSFLGGSSQWSKVSSAALTSPPEAVDATITFYFATGSVSGGHGEVLLDDLALESAGETSPSSTTETTEPVAGEPVAIISWPTTAGVTYQPRSTTDLSSGQWTNLTPVVGDGTTKSVSAPIAGSAIFFRVAYPLPQAEADVTPLFSASTTREPDTMVETSTALVTHLGDRARDRHAREDIVDGVIFRKYDHYLAWYWEQRIAQIEIVDRVAKGGTSITFNYTTQAALNPAEFRAFFRVDSPLSGYHHNVQATLVSTRPSIRYPGETDYNYTTTISTKMPENRALRAGDRVEIEISQFLLASTLRHGRENYYGTTFLYVAGQGVIPWYAKIREETLDPTAKQAASFDSFPLPASSWLGGLTTLPYQYSNEPQHRFKQTAGNITPVSIHPFMLGRRLHHTDFRTGEHTEPGNPGFAEHAGKVGTKFVGQSCVSCHTNNGRALPPAVGMPLLRSVVKVGIDAVGSPHPILGEELQPLATAGAPEGGAVLAGYTTIAGTYDDGTPYSLRKPNYTFQGITPTYYSVRIAPALVGLGLLEAVEESTIQALADPDDVNGDGISGRASIVADPENDGVHRLGRFTYKGAQSRVIHQIAYALNRDMGVTTSVFPVLDGETAAGLPEISDAELDQMNRYVSVLGVGARRDLTDAQAVRGEELFHSASCTSCHAPSLPTGPHHPMAELRSQAIRPFTDLLLHDMGPGLADPMGEDGATGAEWRTAPLWNIGLTAGVSGGEAYLHDGRARTLEEAILWHGGEAESAKEAFRSMPASDRAAIVKFLHSL